MQDQYGRKLVHDAINCFPSVRAVDLFCGIGGLTYGLRSSGIEVRAGVDNDLSCKHAYEWNNPKSKFIHADVRSIRFHDLAPHYKDADVTVLVGCAPCQPFSAHTRGKHNSDEDNCSLVQEFCRLIDEGTPDIVSMENVPGLTKHTAFDQMLTKLDALHYTIDYCLVSCANYGVPQNRRRLVLLASRLGKISIPRETEDKTTVADFIRELPEIKHGQVSTDDPFHVTLPLSPKNYQRICQSKPGGSWKDWDTKIINICHRTANYPAPYGRMSWNAPAPTITTQFCYYSTGRFGHPEQNRAISIREAALLQTFPPNYQFTDKERPLSVRRMARHIGNAVPVKLANAIGTSIMEGANV